MGIFVCCLSTGTLSVCSLQNLEPLFMLSVSVGRQLPTDVNEHIKRSFLRPHLNSTTAYRRCERNGPHTWRAARNLSSNLPSRNSSEKFHEFLEARAFFRAETAGNASQPSQDLKIEPSLDSVSTAHDWKADAEAVMFLSWRWS